MTFLFTYNKKINTQLLSFLSIQLSLSVMSIMSLSIRRGELICFPFVWLIRSRPKSDEAQPDLAPVKCEP
jgi:hypothetical protein